MKKNDAIMHVSKHGKCGNEGLLLSRLFGDVNEAKCFYCKLGEIRSYF